MVSDEQVLARYFSVLDTLPDHVFVFSESGEYLDVYGGAENATGFDCKPFIGRRLHDVMPQELADGFLAHIVNAIRTQETQYLKYKFEEGRMIELPNGLVLPKELWFEGVIKSLPIDQNGQRSALWIAKNITTQHYLEMELKHLSEVDELTGVYNRRSFTKLLQAAIDRFHDQEEPCALILFDIDNFKRVNDTLGHNVGDEVIRHVVNVFRAGLGPSMSMGRIGGEEFAILAPQMQVSEALALSEALRTTLFNTSCETDLYEIHVTASLGIAEVCRDDGNTLGLLSRADEAMYESKKRGRNQSRVFKPSVKEEWAEVVETSWIKVKGL
ncbi:Response regulator PleD [Marinomonas aquimarina]|uniref:diguanylate cyclase n=1 Tax=Marinomonas aquimarina TaxID=295068 RepID=A0A1A8TDR7_9GAMM|nr:sensor domain-containing diguanylate cyclase [Marinomonas aquimarina]SBS30502.1 Response regulator PleD [Marinomonas aquimarina]